MIGFYVNTLVEDDGGYSDFRFLKRYEFDLVHFFGYELISDH